MSYFVTEESVEKAMQLAKPSIHLQLQQAEVEDRHFIAITVIEPEGQLFNFTFGQEPTDIERRNRYIKNALAKAKMCHRTGKTSGHIVDRTPWLLLKGDCRYAGGVVEDDLAVGVSGLQAHLDEVIAWLIFNQIAGRAKHALVEMEKNQDAPAILT